MFTRKYALGYEKFKINKIISKIDNVSTKIKWISYIID